ncbi:DNA repair and recombination protein rhm52 [Elsinoe australis]|uniref:RAD52 homolog n=1 Tax=Elsinoe australis TaxID=40998 RepID=A0A4U7AZY8_9PEZI|nr:DNA repair and recombination protein rhm52 [Elsinoe australis]
MPAQRDINRLAHAIDNPFDEAPKRISEYTATEIATLSARLDKQLGPEYISTRQGQGGGRVHYIAGEKVINLANEVFGFNGWSSSIQQVQVDFVDENPNSGKVDLGLSVIVRITLKDGTYHEDIGYGRIENCKGKGIAFEKAKKEGATDGLKRALRNFGKVLGNCLYDKDYLQKVSKIKVPPAKWDESNLYRHADYSTVKKEVPTGADAASLARSRMRSDHSAVSHMTNGSTEYGEDEFGGNLFEEMDFTHPDEVRIDYSTAEDDQSTGNGQQTPRRPNQRVQSGPEAQRAGPAGPNTAQQALPTGHAGAESMRPPQNMQQNQRPAQPNNKSIIAPGPTVTAQQGPPPQANGQPQKPPEGPPPGASVGFMAGRAVMEQTNKPFNPLAESPSIRRTAGIDLTKSKPVKRQDIGLPPPPEVAPSSLAEKPGSAILPRTNFVNPAADAHRRIGAPAAQQSPTMNRNAYKPPSVKRPAPMDVASRPPLTETTNVPGRTDVPSDAKKVKVDPPPQQAQVEAAKT